MYYLIDKATEYAHRAVAADKKGEYEKAIRYYKAAIDLFVKFLKLYPDNSMAQVYRELIRKYRERVKILERNLTRVTASGSNGSSDDVEVIIFNGSGGPKFKDLVDLEEVKRALKRAVIYPIRSPHLFPLGWPKGILLFGPPGCGKTLISMALANEVGAVLINISPATIMSKWLGEAEKNVARVFKKARETARSGRPVIIFIDEVDALFQEYSDEVGGEKRVRNQFLMEMDGLKAKEDIKLPLFVIGATNKPWKLDIGFIRRFDKRIYVKPPDRTVRKKLFEYYIGMLAQSYDISGVDFDKLADMTENYSPDDIFKIVREVQSNLAEEYHEKGMGKRVITTEDFIEVIKRRKPSIDPQYLEAYKAWNEKYGAE
ncbi:MAG: AAA family ATPase [Thermoprotei archaeon]